jgi:hypothetical protein
MYIRFQIVNECHFYILMIGTLSVKLMVDQLSEDYRPFREHYDLLLLLQRYGFVEPSRS